MKTNNHQIVDYSAVIEKRYGHSTAERTKFDEEALPDARKNRV